MENLQVRWLLCVLSLFAVQLKPQEVLGKHDWINQGVITSRTNFLCVGKAGFSWFKQG